MNLIKVLLNFRNSRATKKRRRVPTLSQRRAANIRERRRMFNLNEAFDRLRTKVGWLFRLKWDLCVCVSFERMLLRQISWRILLHPNLDWQFICSIDSVSKNTQVLISLAAIFNQRHFHSKPTLLLSLSPQICCSLFLSPSAYFPIMFYLSTFQINTWHIWCLIIIDRNKLIEQTMSFHLGIAHSKSCDVNNRDEFLKSLTVLKLKNRVDFIYKTR